MKHPMEIVLKCALTTMALSHAPAMKDLFWQLITWDVKVKITKEPVLTHNVFIIIIMQ